MSYLRRVTACAVGSLLILTAAACGSSTSDGGGSGATKTSAAVAALEKEPTTIPLTTPLPEKPKEGGTFVFIKCEVPQCALQLKGFQAAAKAVGWKVVDIPFVSTDPSSLAPAFKQALALKPAAINFGGMPYELWSRYIPDFEKAGTIIVPSYIGEAPLTDTVPVNAAGPANDKALAGSLARWVADDSGGKANVLVQKIGAYNAVVGWATEFKAALEEICPGCKVREIENSATQITGAGAAQSIVSQIRKDPSIDYFVGYNGAFFGGLNQALKNAQLKVKVGGMFPLPQNIQDVQKGSGGAFLAVNNQYLSWFVMDVALRHAQGAPHVPLEQQLFPAKLSTKASAKTSEGDFAGPVDYQDQFLKLWKVE